jgi:translation initiation factor 2B subunit (eIF-2B alpha/beta/delta family)
MTNSKISPQHYSKYKIEPIDFIQANKLDFAQGNVIKYVLRYKDKNGIEDLQKAKQNIDFLIKYLEKANAKEPY